MYLVCLLIFALPVPSLTRDLAANQEAPGQARGAKGSVLQ